jgi:hypothetical protein
MTDVGANALTGGAAGYGPPTDGLYSVTSFWARGGLYNVFSWLAKRGRSRWVGVSEARPHDGLSEFCLSALITAEDVEVSLKAVKKDIADVEERLRRLAESYPG